MDEYIIGSVALLGTGSLAIMLSMIYLKENAWHSGEKMDSDPPHKKWVRLIVVICGILSLIDVLIFSSSHYIYLLNSISGLNIQIIYAHLFSPFEIILVIIKAIVLFFENISL